MSARVALWNLFNEARGVDAPECCGVCLGVCPGVNSSPCFPDSTSCECVRIFVGNYYVI